MKSLLTVFVTIFLVLLVSQPTAAYQLFLVVRVVHGDTVEINYQGNKEKVRLLCVNTPESVHPDRTQNVPMGKVASRYTKYRLLGNNVELVRQGLSPNYTKYGKIVTHTNNSWKPNQPRERKGETSGAAPN